MEILAAADFDWLTALLVLAGTTVGGAVVWVANFWAGRQALRRKEQKEDEKTITDHMEKLNARQATEIVELRAEVRQTLDRVTTLTGHVLYLEGVMEARGIKFRPLALAGEDSGPHRPLDPRVAGVRDDAGDRSPA